MKASLLAMFILLSSAAFAADVETVAPANLTERPSPTKTVKPEAPSKKRAIVVVEIIIDKTGEVISATVKKSDDTDFEPAAVEAAKQWKFRPGKQGEKAVATRVLIPFRFNNDDE